MNIHVTYAVWTYADVRARIIEAAETLVMHPAALGPRMQGSMSDLFNEYRDDYRRGEATPYRRVPSPGALARMEETWSWINTWLDEQQRKLVYEYGFLMTRKGITIAGWCERNGWIRRTFERAVNRACQRIADNLNRKHQVRLTMPVDRVSQNGAEHAPFEVASDNRAPVRRRAYHRADDAIPIHLPGSEAEVAKHIEKVNLERRQEAERQRKAALKRAEEAARLAAKIAERKRKKQEKAAA